MVLGKTADSDTPQSGWHRAGAFDFISDLNGNSMTSYRWKSTRTKAGPSTIQSCRDVLQGASGAKIQGWPGESRGVNCHPQGFATDPLGKVSWNEGGRDGARQIYSV
jgi:hypothetical protein